MFDNKNIFVTGGTGSWGHELVRQLLANYNPTQIVIYSRGEHKQVEMRQEFDSPKLKFVIGDVRDSNILTMAMKGADYVFHLAALKHVPVCEENSWEAVLTNVYGTQNVIEAAIKNKVKKVVDISTDKAVDPFNHYGVTKACGEKLIINANRNYQSETSFLCIRGGNVLGTNGSVIPLFEKQINTNNCITVTDPAMTRYLMSTRDAIGLVFAAVDHAHGGEVFVMRMPATTVENIAEAMVSLVGDESTETKVIGLRPGEKMDEVLVSRNEAPRTKIINSSYYVILPQYNDEELEKQYQHLAPIGLPEFTSRNAEQLSCDTLKVKLDQEFSFTKKKDQPTQSKRKIGLTGASGFVGSNLIAYLADTYEVVPFNGDIKDQAAIKEYLQENPEIKTVVHLAALVTGEDQDMWSVNVGGTKNLLDALSSIPDSKIVFASTSAVYDQSSDKELSKEEDLPVPGSSYGVTKIMAEQLIHQYSEQSGIKYTILRFASIYGPGNSKGVIYNFLTDIKESGKITLYGDGTQRRNFLHVVDACQAISQAISHSSNDIINISPTANYSLNEVITILKKEHEFTVNMQPANNPMHSLIMSNIKAVESLGFKPKFNELNLDD